MPKKPPTPQTGIEKAIAQAEGQTNLAVAIGASQQMVAYWKKKGIVSDASMCAAIERATGVRCEELNPHEDWTTLRVVLCAPDRDRIDASDDVQPPVGGSSGTEKQAKVVL
ncbi:transcriptional regulator [Paraburkholderia unamae]|uniref:DNA-binding transcriptional regulator YdaS (Cro superfamily) n=1 Tax=Paraburkholderia unamae TaxID=219649 RepID=A0ABX5K8T5_9BURK|nr:YdaS family helix-turn-helix protein [Paraburkholderia unamae]PVX61269.1 DNA-binding transcriptional regulator YdaS (Cro superfamily) [Paraburkholderia unamae]